MAQFGRDPVLAAITNFTQSFLRARELRRQNDLAIRREQRFERQLTQQVDLSQARLGVSRERLEFDKTRPRSTTSIKVFSPNQGLNIQSTILEEFARLPIDTSDRDFWTHRSQETDFISAEDAANVRDRIRSRTGYDFLSPAQQSQIDAEFDFVAGSDLDQFREDPTGRRLFVRPSETAESPQPTPSPRPLFSRSTVADPNDVDINKTPIFGATATESKHKVGDEVTMGGRRFIITGFDEDGTPVGDPL